MPTPWPQELSLMRRIVVISLLCVAIALLVWAFSTRGKEGMLFFFLGGAILLSTLVIVGMGAVSTQSANNQPPTNTYAILGAILGLFLGGLAGAKISFLGRAMIAIFNPDLPERDYGTSFGVIGGALLGAFVLALLLSQLQKLIVQPESAVPANDSQDSLPSSSKDTA